MIKIKRALISVSDKSGLEELVKALHEFNVQIVSTGGTAAYIQGLGIPVRRVSDMTQFPEMFDGRVKTLHPKIHGGLLALRGNRTHTDQAKKFGIEFIDMVVVNLYPFEKTVADSTVTLETAIENIDIGGPAMLRSAAKNYRSVAVICRPQRYRQIIDEMKAHNGALDEQTCLQLAVEVFERTAGYDRAITAFLKTRCPQQTQLSSFPDTMMLQFEKVQELRYGENPHQKGAFYKEAISLLPGVAAARQLHGKELSFNNILDLDAALDAVKDFEKPAAVIIKHTNPCGVAVAQKISSAYKDALACDPLSAFGSVVGLNRSVDQETAQAIVNADFVECVVSPGFSPAALEVLKKKKNLRIMDMGDFARLSTGEVTELDFKRVSGGILVENKDVSIIDTQRIKTIAPRKLSEKEMESLLFAWTVVKHVKSNAIVLAKGTKTVGIGAGQMSRVDSVIISIRKSGGRCQGAVMASDAFFPKADAIEEAAKAGICAIIQPGGSIRDEEVMRAAEKAGIAVVLTGMRHFRH